MPEQANFGLRSRTGAEELEMKQYRSANKKKMKKDPGRFLLKKMRAEEEALGINIITQHEPISGNILDNHLLDSELNNPISEGGVPHAQPASSGK